MNKRQVLKITSPMCPTNNHYMAYRIAYKDRARKFPFIQAYKPAETMRYEREFKKCIQEALKEQEWTTPGENDFIIMECDFYLPKKRIDPNNCFKVPCDVLTDAGVWLDDDMVLNKSERVYFDTQNPRIEITIYLATHVGVFDTEEEYQTFKSTNCDLCGRGAGKTNCSIHKKAIESRVQEEIDVENLKCIKFKTKK